jgi:hypothetical protein
MRPLAPSRLSRRLAVPALVKDRFRTPDWLGAV